MLGLRWIVAGVLLMAAACTPAKDAEIVGAVATAELAQGQHIRPSEITVVDVQFLDRQHAHVRLAERIPGSRGTPPNYYTYDAKWQKGRWQVEAMERKPE